MEYTLIIGDRTYSSWSLRAWLILDVFGLPHALKHVSFSDDDANGWKEIDALPTARTVPTLVTPDGAIVSDSLAIAEELASRHPEAGLWPTDISARAVARTLSAEMHSGFSALRQECPMNLRVAYSGFEPNQAVRADVDRIEVIWQDAFARIGGPWLVGEYSVVDAFYAPVAARIAGHGISVGPVAQSYVGQQLAHPAFRRWRAMSLVRGPNLSRYAKDNAQVAWPGPPPRIAERAEGPSLNETCPYSGGAVSHFLRYGGKVYGFCNAFCRDKTLADPEAWPDFQAIVK